MGHFGGRHQKRSFQNSVPSKTDPEAIVVFGKHEAKTWGVVLNVNTLNVITVRPASKKERRFYEQKTGS